jgi:ABC-type branched-subunit amino acid transport system ATPase component/ABC-type branched-subunit amino acid transport system permease subunit
LKTLYRSGLVVAAGVVVVLTFGQAYAGSVFVLALCYAIVTAGMAVQLGFSQQIVFSQCVFMGAGAYGVALLNTHFAMPALLATPIVMAGAGLAALLLGSIVTRASGLALAVATLMLPLIATGYVSSAGYLGGSVGAPLTGNLWNGSSTESIAIGNGLITVAVLAVVVFVASRILSSDIGLELYVLGVDERTAAAMGVRTPRRKLELFVLGSVLAALGGAVYAGTQLFVPATLVDPTAELALLIMLFVGGRRSVLGAVTGALVIQYLYGASSWVSVNILIIEGVLLTAVLLVDPEGLAGILATLTRRLRPLLPPLLPAPLRSRPSVPLRSRPSAPLRSRPSAPLPADPRSAAPSTPNILVTRPSPKPEPAQCAVGPERALLECVGVGKEYGGLTVLDDVTLTLPPRGLFGLCGPNGAGKSTLLGIVGGSVSPSRGRILLDGADVTRLPPQQRFGLGVSRTFQAVHLIAGRTVLDNVAVACLTSHRSSIVTRIARSSLAQARAAAAQTLDRLGMAAISDRDVSSLTLESQRMVELARAIAARPRLLLLDEPASGLSEQQRQRLGELLREFGEMTCVLLVEHDLDLVAQLSQRIFVLAGGRLVFDGGPADFRASPTVNSLLVGL